MFKPSIAVVAFFFLIAATARPASADSLSPTTGKNLKVYVMVGFHVDFYHSWRGDTPDDAGYGYDVKIIRSSIRKLNDAKAKGLKAKAYWDFAGNHWTFGEFIPKHFPDMIPLFQTRDGIDEFVAGPFNNGMGAAATKKEFLKSVEWTMSNPDGYGLKQLFKNVGTSYRPQEMSIASHQNRWLKEAGVQSLILYYAACAFDAFAPFTAPLTWEERLNPLWMKTTETDEPIILLAAMSTVDLVNYVSLEKLMIDLRAKQLSGEIKRNVAIHLNMDADALSWEPVVPNKTLRKLVPNAGGLQEIIDAVNKFAWADFTTPSEYLKIEQPKKTIFIRQDTADGSFTGFASWAEKENTGRTWPKVERSRVIDQLLESQKITRAQKNPWVNRGFIDRVLALSTTHYGMATPFVHRERAARLETYTDGSLKALDDELHAWLSKLNLTSLSGPTLSFFEFPRFGQIGSRQSVQHQSFVVSSSLKGGPSGVPFIRRGIDADTDVIETFRAQQTSARSHYTWSGSQETACSTIKETSLMGSGGLKVEFSPISGISSVVFAGQSFGDGKFFSPFVSWKSNVSLKKGLKTSVLAEQVKIPEFAVDSQTCASAPDIQETRLKGTFILRAPKTVNSLDAEYRFWTDRNRPFLFVDVTAFIPVTVDETADDPVDRRYMSHVDYRLQELALAQIQPILEKSTAENLKVWKMNYEGDLSYYALDYEKFNPANLHIDSINNQLTPGWVAVSNGTKGFLIAFQTNKRASFGAIPMRVRGDLNSKSVLLNPFGTYFGKQFDYSHVGGEKLGTLLANLGGVFVRPNAPSYSGKNIHFELMMAPYLGDAPSAELIRAALDFAYPAVGILAESARTAQNAPKFQDDFLGEQLSFERLVRAREQKLYGETLTPPVGLAVTPMDRGARILWQSTHPTAVSEYEVSYRKKGLFSKWQSARTKETTLILNGLQNGKTYEVSVKAFGKAGVNDVAQVSAATRIQTLKPTDQVKDAFVNEIAPSPRLIWMFAKTIVEHARSKDPERKKDR